MRRDFALPGTRARYAPDRICDVQHIAIAIELDIEGRSIKGRSSLTLAPIDGPPRWIALDAVELAIHRVSCAGKDLDFSHDGKVLRVDMRPLYRDASPAGPVVVDIDYSGSPRRGLYFVGPDQAYPDKPVQVWSQGQDEDSRFWFPCFDSPHEKATSEVIATVPRQLMAVSNGALVADTTLGDKRTVHWRFDTPHSCYLIVLVAGEFSVIHDRWRDVDVTYYVAPGREDQARRALGRTAEMLELFSTLFGVAYPYQKYAQIFVADFIFGGMENTTATTLTDMVLMDERAALDYDVEALVSHELAHQWFGDLITCREWGQGWLNEGFATYAEYLWREHAEGRDAADVELHRWAEEYFSEDSGRYRRKVATRVYDEPLDIFDRHLYEKGGRVLHMLRQILGDEPLWKAIAHYLEKHRTGSVDTRDLALAIEATTGRVLDWFFEQWITEGAGHPELDVKYVWDAEHHLACFTVVQTHKVEGETPLFRLPVKVRFRAGKAHGKAHGKSGDGKSGDGDIDMDMEIAEKEQTFFFSLDREPAQAIFDPGKTLLARVKTNKGIALLIEELEHATLAADRIHAAEELSRRGGRQAEDALIAALDKDPFWAVRAAAARALGERRTERALAALIQAAAATEHPRARRGVVQALGAFREQAAAAEALIRIIEAGDPSYFVEAEACLSLGKTRSPRAAAILREASGRDSFMDIIRQNVYRGLAEARDDSAADLLREATAYGRPSQGRRAALLSLARLGAGRRDRLAHDARDLAEGLLLDRDFWVQATAIEALGVLADPAAIPALRKRAERDVDRRLRRRAREVVRDIESGARASEQIEALRDELARLQSDCVTLRERVDRLDAAGQNQKKKRKKKIRESRG
jgi:aminopeptidase N